MTTFPLRTRGPHNSGLAVRALLVVAAVLLGPVAAFGCDCGASCGCGPACLCGAAPQGASTQQVRRNQSSFSDQEKQDLVDAMKALKVMFRPGATLSIYDEYVELHGQSFDLGQAHGSSAFLPWHRELLRRFEADLQAVNPAVTLPYWDFTVDNQPTSSLWSPNFLGGNGDPSQGDAVLDGPFRRGEWVLEVSDFDEPYLRRQFGQFAPSLPTAADVEAAFGIGQYDAFPFDVGSPLDESFRNFLEGFNHPTAEPELHNRVHIWIGGSSALRLSPNDPVFWLLHANIDRVWAEWQDLYGLTYLPVTGGPEGHNLHDLMTPFGVTPADVLDHRALGYRYDTQPAGIDAVPAPGGFVLAVAGALSLIAFRRTLRRSSQPPLPPCS